MLATRTELQPILDENHPCFGCEVRSAAVCHVLDCADLTTMRQMGWSIRLTPGQTLFHEGDPVTRVFTLTRGAMKLYKLLPDGRRQITGFIFPGDFLGISVDDEHAFTAEALSDSQLCWFPRNRFDAFVEATPLMERALYQMAAHELAAAQQQMVLLGRKTAEERVCSFFLTLAAQAEKVSGAEVRFVDLPMGRADIADFLGLTKETVSRVLAQLKNKRLIRLARLDRVEILDRHGLAEVAEGLVAA